MPKRNPGGCLANIHSSRSPSGGSVAIDRQELEVGQLCFTKKRMFGVSIGTFLDAVSLARTRAHTLSCSHMSKMPAIAEFEVALGPAVRASLSLPANERPCFIGRYLLAGIDIDRWGPMPEAEGSPMKGDLGLDALGVLISDVMNTTKSVAGWPTRAVAETLTTMTPEGPPRLADRSPMPAPLPSPFSGSILPHLTLQLPPLDALAVASVLLGENQPGPALPNDSNAVSSSDNVSAPTSSDNVTASAASVDADVKLRTSMRVSFDGIAKVPSRLSHSMYRKGETSFKGGLSFLSRSGAEIRIGGESVLGGIKEADGNGEGGGGEGGGGEGGGGEGGGGEGVKSEGDFATPKKLSSFGARAKSFAHSLGKEKMDELRASREIDSRSSHAAMVATAAFEIFDADKSGTIDKFELFSVLMDLGRVAPMCGSLEEQVHARKCVCMHACVYACMHVCMHACMHGAGTRHR